MKRIYLAAGPWIVCASNQAQRIVLYAAKTNELVVHTQTYESGGQIGREVIFTNGDYFKKEDVCKAMVCWEDRNRNNSDTPDDQPHRYASYEFATAANAADLAQQYFREMPALTPEQIANALTLKEVAALTGKPVGAVREEIKLEKQE